jgi:hypothetical protein
MIKGVFGSRWRLLSAGLFIACWAAGCAGRTGANLRAWIDVPLEAAVITASEDVIVRSHAYAERGVAEFMLTVNGEPLRRDPPDAPGASFAAVSQPWAAPSPGSYKLEVIAYDLAGAASAPAVAHVQVVEPATPTPTSVPTNTPTPMPTPTPTPVPQAEALFWADNTSLTAGACTQLHWDVASAAGVSLDGNPVAPQGSQQACPTATTTYWLHVTAPSGDFDRSVTITVAAPADTAGPTVTEVSNSPALIWDGSSCGPTQATISANVSDPSAVSQVVLHYRVTRGGEAGSWQTLTMGSVGGGNYQATLGPAQLTASLPNYGEGLVEYYVVAVDALGNSTQSGSRGFEAKLCFG